MKNMKINTYRKLNGLFVNKSISFLLNKGKKQKARIVYVSALENLNKINRMSGYQRNTTYTILNAVSLGSPKIGMFSVRAGRIMKKKPILLKKIQRKFIGLRFLMESFKEQSRGKKWISGFVDLILVTLKGQGVCIKKQKDLHLKAVSNRSLIYLK